jgi:hypothetical protein
VHALLSHYDELSLRKMIESDQVSNNVRIWTNNYQLLLQNTKKEEEEEEEEEEGEEEEEKEEQENSSSNSINKSKSVREQKICFNFWHLA